MLLRDPQPRHQEFEGGDELPERVLSVYAGAQEVLASANLRDDVLIRWSRGLDPGQRRCTVRLHDFLIKTGWQSVRVMDQNEDSGPGIRLTDRPYLDRRWLRTGTPTTLVAKSAYAEKACRAHKLQRDATNPVPPLRTR